MQETKVAACAACHFSDIRAARFFFDETFPSVVQQKRRADKVYISWSASAGCVDFCHERWALVVNTEDVDWLTVLHSPIQLFQFQHYEIINRAIQNTIHCDPHQCWYLIFGDSDDLWQDIRIEHMVETAREYLDFKSVFVFNWKRAPDGYVEVSQESEKEQFEYWMCMVKADVFNSFYSSLTDPRYLANHWTDLAFDKYLLTYGDAIQYFLTDCQFLVDTDPWLYRHMGNNSVRHRGFVQKTDRLVEHMVRRLMELYPGPIVDNEGFSDSACTVQIHRPITIDDVSLIRENRLQLSEVLTVLSETPVQECVVN